MLDVQELNLENAENLFVQLLDEYPFSIYYNEAYIALYQINFKQENYSKAINFLLELNEMNNKQRFDLAYSYFQIDSLDLAKLNFQNYYRLNLIINLHLNIILHTFHINHRIINHLLDGLRN